MMWSSRFPVTGFTAQAASTASETARASRFTGRGYDKALGRVSNELLRGKAAVDGERRAGDERRRVREQKDDRFRDFLRGSDPSDRLRGGQRVDDGGRAAGEPIEHRRLDHAGT